MKIEEIEEQAEHQACAHIGISTYKRNPDAYSLFKTGFRVGAKQGMEHAIEWHDLRENPDDLPKCAENKQIVFYVKEFNTDIEKDTSHFCLGFYAKSFMNDDIKVFVEKSKGYECEHLSQEVIKWCELP